MDVSADTRHVVYEVNLEVDVEIADDYRDWLDAHVVAILALPGFISAHILDVLEPAPPDGSVGLCVHYTLRDHTAFEQYLREHAAAMRADGQARFGGRFRAGRRVLQAAAHS